MIEPKTGYISYKLCLPKELDEALVRLQKTGLFGEDRSEVLEHIVRIFLFDLARTNFWKD